MNFQRIGHSATCGIRQLLEGRCGAAGRPWRRLVGIGWGLFPWLGILTVLAILCASVLHAAPPSTVTPDTAVDYRTASAFFPFIQHDPAGAGSGTSLCVSTISGRILPPFVLAPDTPVPYIPVGGAYRVGEYRQPQLHEVRRAD